MSHLCLMTLPGLDVRSDWRPVHDCLLDEFPAISDVLATTMAETLLVIHDGAPDTAWIDSASAAVFGAGRRRSSRRQPWRRQKLHSVVSTGYDHSDAALERFPRAPRSA
jgi:hypothetical protein